MSAGRQRPDFIIIGRITKPHGVKGALKVEAMTHDPQRFRLLKRVYLGVEDKPGDAVEIENIQLQPQGVILSLRGVESRQDAERLRNLYIYLPAEEAMSLPAGAVYIFDLVGLDVYTTDGEFVGVVKDYHDYPANGMFIVEKNGREILIPDVADIVNEIDIDAGKIILNPIEGLLE
ncbi:16S rRNA processing protein RimM [candidate division KSB1 bacterium]|nr:16S rRNA processing protein RimM [candidate division KSB1 bacterium]